MNKTIELYTIGFTKKGAEQFFTSLRVAGVRTLVDVRLNNISQLAGFTKKEDLRFFLKEVANIEYVHIPYLAPTQEILDEYKKLKGRWEIYEKKFLDLMEERHIENVVPREMLDHGCLLCSEDKPHHCHRRLVAEYLQSRRGDVHTTHIK